MRLRKPLLLVNLSLILLDIVMPGMDGFGVLEYMNRNNLIGDIPVIMISGEDSGEVTGVS